jgi:hypothetical protein
MSGEAPENGSEDDDVEAREALAALDFSTYILTIASSAMISLGRLPAPNGEIEKPDPEQAKQLIDILGMLEDKTRGNLDQTEERLLQSLLYDLRTAYVDVRSGKP